MISEPNSPRQRQFRLVCISEDHTAMAGGVPAVVDQLSYRVASCGIPVNQVHIRCSGMPSREGVEADCIVPSRLGKLWGWSSKLRKHITHIATLPIPPVFHLHGIWAAPQFIAARVAKENSIPFIVSAHGMLEPWLWKRQGCQVRAKKRIYWNLFAYPALRLASVIHAITPLEKKSLSSLFPSNRIEVIPNAIDLNEYSDVINQKREHLILFVGRLEPIKGVDILLNAFIEADLDSSWRLAIIGPVWSAEYKAELEKIVDEKGIRDRVSFLGPVFGEEKHRWMRKAWVLAVPSHSEVMGMVNLEAAACRTPSITTYQSGLDDWEQGGGILFQPNVEELGHALQRACAWSDRERDERGAASRRLVSERYSWDAVLPRWISLYESLLSDHL